MLLLSGALAQIGFDGQIELEALRLRSQTYGYPHAQVVCAFGDVNWGYLDDCYP